MAETRIDRVRRIVAAVPPAGDMGGLLRVAARAARMWRAELSAVLVDDRDLALLARLSVARHYLGATAQPLPLTGDLLRLAQSAARSRTEALLTRLLASSRVSWHLQESAAASDALGEDDLLLVCPGTAQAGDWLRSALDSAVAVAAVLVEGAGHSALELAVVHDGSAAGERSLALAVRLAGDFGAMCRVLVPASQERSLASASAAILQSAGIRFTVDALSSTDAATIAEVLHQSRVGVLLLPAEAETVCRLQALLAYGETRTGGATE
jgi:hypothetical protein